MTEKKKKPNVDVTKKARDIKKARRKSQDEYYASMCGPVTVRKIGE